MSLFIFSLLAGLLLHQIVSFIQPIAGSHTYKFGRRIVVELPERTYLIWKVGSFVFAFLLFISTITIIVAQSVHPAEGYAYRFADALTSPRMAAAVFGGLVGILLGNLLNRLLKNSHDYKFTSSDRLQIILIFALVILGVGGEEFLRSSAQRISKVSLGTTTEISFSESRPRSSRAAAEQPNSAFRNTAGDSGGSAGLGKLYDLGSPEKPNIERDKRFIEVLALYEQVSKPALKDIGRFAADVLSPIASCLSGIFRLNGDATFIQQQLSPLSEALRDLATGTEINSEVVRLKLKGPIESVAQYARPRLGDIQPLGERYSCKEIITTADKIDDISKNFDSINLFKGSSDLPYAAIAYASAMAALHHYESAAITMHDWLEKHSPRTIEGKWYALRARLAQSLFLEEWIRARGLAASDWLRQYHIENLKAIADGMQSFKAIWALSQGNGDYKWNSGLLGASHSGDDGLCNFPAVPKTPSNNAERPPDAEEKDLLENSL